MSGIITVWADVVLSRIAGWIRIPHETTLSRLIRTFHYRNVNTDLAQNIRVVLSNRRWILHFIHKLDNQIVSMLLI